MTRLTYIATATILVLSGSAVAATEVLYDRSKLGDPAYVDEIREKIEVAAKKECRAEYRGDWDPAAKIRGCTREATNEPRRNSTKPFNFK